MIKKDFSPTLCKSSNFTNENFNFISQSEETNRTLDNNFMPLKRSFDKIADQRHKDAEEVGIKENKSNASGSENSFTFIKRKITNREKKIKSTVYKQNNCVNSSDTSENTQDPPF
ncbi:hypothetical protein COBT_002699 [Conglomerata obtusa]